MAITDQHVSEGRSSTGTERRVADDLKGKTARGALISVLSQGTNFVLRIGSMMILARILGPKDFGLVAMVTACTDFLSLFRDAGLSMATVQRASISREQTSMLFWVNLMIGGLLAAFCAAAAPLLTRFYHEPRLFWITVVVGTGFVFSAAAAQHRATLQRDMRFAILSSIDVASLVLSIALSIGMAMAGLGYWALVGRAICPSLVLLIGVWLAAGWTPVAPRRGTNVIPMLKYGGTVTLMNLISYIGSNADKVLVGRFLGAEVLGIYGRAYQLSSLPTDNLNSTVGLVAFPALSRLQNDPEHFKDLFLKGYGLFLSVVMPISMSCALFAEDIVRIFLGNKWDAAAPLFRLLAPTVFGFAILNPLYWLLMSTGRATRSLRIELFVTPCLIIGYAVGLRYGPAGVAAGFSIALTLWVVPVIFWATRSTPVAAVDILKVLARPLLSILIAAGVSLCVWNIVHSLAPVLIRLIVATGVLFGVYAVVLCFVMDQKAIYVRLLREIGIGRFARWGTKEKSVEGDVA